jgi:hypothetical protein
MWIGLCTKREKVFPVPGSQYRHKSVISMAWTGSALRSGNCMLSYRKLLYYLHKLKHELAGITYLLTGGHPAAGPWLIHPSDEGTRYGSVAFGQRCRLARQSIDGLRRGNPRRRAVRELLPDAAFELPGRRRFRGQVEVQTVFFDFISGMV